MREKKYTLTETSGPLISIVSYCRWFCVAFMVVAVGVEWTIFDLPPKGLTLVIAVILLPVLAAVFSLVARSYLFSSNYYFTHRSSFRWVVWGGLMGLFSQALSRWLSSQPTIWSAFFAIASIYTFLVISYWIAFRIHPLQVQNPPSIPGSELQKE